LLQVVGVVLLLVAAVARVAFVQQLPQQAVAEV
jgi:hypothetical protein